MTTYDDATRPARLVIADPPYPPSTAVGGRKPRASRWYGSGQLAKTDRAADVHPDADQWDDPSRHRQLIEELHANYDGWAIATSPDGIAAYGTLPTGTRIMAWVKPNATPGSHRLMSRWEPVLVFVPPWRRSSRTALGSVSDVLTAAAPRYGFAGAKPEPWTRWILDALGYQDTDTVVDLFPGSGAVTAAISQTVLPLETP